jgi:peroxiredoxin
MKRYLISIITVLLVLMVAWPALGQEEERTRQRENIRQRFQNMTEAEREKFRAEMRQRRERFENMSEEEREKLRAEMRQRFGGRFGLGREEQLTAIKSIEEQVAKLKAAVQSMGPEDRSRFRELSVEERTQLREKMAKAGRERMSAIRAIEQQLAKIQGPRQRQQPQAGRQPSVDELKLIHALAVKEQATQTAQRLERLIARYQRESRVDREPRQRPERLDRPQRERPERQRRDVEGERSGRGAPEFELNSFEGKTISLSDYSGRIVVLEWMNFECPFSLYHYQTKNTMVDLAKKYKGKNVVWLVINSTNHTTQGANKTFAEKYSLPFPILDDRSGTVGRAYGAETTPHMYIINTRGRIVYEGAIDDSPMGKKKEGVINYVDKALAELTAGKTVSTSKTKPYGCTVKYAKK